MKATDQDYELALRFPTTADGWGFAKSMSDAKVSPSQLEKLLKLGLLKPSRQNGAAPSPMATPGKGSFFRGTDHYIRTFERKPK